MNKSEIRDWEKRTGHLKKEELLQLALLSEIRFYENDIPPGYVLDIGTGLGSEAVYFAFKDRKVYAVDKEIYFLDRIASITQNKIEVLESNMPEGPLPDQKFALVILSNILHFLSLNNSIKVCKRVSKLMVSGGYALVRVHSKKHPYSKSRHKKNHKFKHFFSLNEVKAIFPRKQFELIFLSNYHRQFSNDEITLMGLSQAVCNSKDAYTLIVRKR